MTSVTDMPQKKIFYLGNKKTFHRHDERLFALVDYIKD